VPTWRGPRSTCARHSSGPFDPRRVHAIGRQHLVGPGRLEVERRHADRATPALTGYHRARDPVRTTQPFRGAHQISVGEGGANLRARDRFTARIGDRPNDGHLEPYALSERREGATVAVHAPLVFDVIDTWNGRAIGGCTYHEAHPGGLSFDRFPVNANEAETRRRARFFAIGHTPGPTAPRIARPAGEHPVTLDLRRPT